MNEEILDTDNCLILDVKYTRRDCAICVVEGCIQAIDAKKENVGVSS
jgi:hypothetical protein